MKKRKKRAVKEDFDVFSVVMGILATAAIVVAFVVGYEEGVDSTYKIRKPRKVIRDTWKGKGPHWYD